MGSTVQVYPSARRQPPERAGSDDGEGRNRTGDTTIFSRVLYQLSYLAAAGKASYESFALTPPFELTV